VRVFGTRRGDAEGYAEMLGGEMCTNPKCPSMRFCEKEQTQTNRKRCCGGGGGVKKTPGVMMRGVGESIGSSISSIFERQREVEDTVVREQAIEDERLREMGYERPKLGLRERMWAGWKTMWTGRVQRAPPRIVRVAIEEPRENDEQPANERNREGVFPVPVNDGADVAVWKPMAMAMRNGEFIWDDTERKKMAMHMSIVGTTGSGKTYLTKHLLQKARGLWKGGAVFWVTTEGSWDSNASLLKVRSLHCLHQHSASSSLTWSLTPTLCLCTGHH
jgi:hypothetical protein